MKKVSCHYLSLHKFRVILVLGLMLPFFITNIFAQSIEAKIKIVSNGKNDSSAHIEGKFINPIKSETNAQIVFLRNYADAVELEKRIENLRLFDEKGERIETREFSAGVYQAAKPFTSFVYDVRISVPNQQTSAAHISWINENGGLLMLNDLLPQWNENQITSTKISFEIPIDWKITGSEKQTGINIFEIQNFEKAVFLIGSNQREKRLQFDKSELVLATAGDWQFTDDEAAQMARSIVEEYSKIFGEIPFPNSQIFILPFPRGTSQPDRWRAETRGSTVTIISGIVPLKSQALQRLHEQLRHEIFHWWIPNSLNLTGDYAWFYEGFAVYQALRTGVELNQIRFQDYLDTLARAYDLARNQNRSLIEISNSRWTGSSGSVYAKGMIAAFLCDAAIIRSSRGRHSLSDIFRQIYQKYKIPNQRQESGAAIIGVLNGYPELKEITRNYILGTNQINWRNELAAFGIENTERDFQSKLKVIEKPNGKQKDLLDKLGYNQWRKLASENNR